jgi:hypothetical protein
MLTTRQNKLWKKAIDVNEKCCPCAKVAQCHADTRGGSGGTVPPFLASVLDGGEWSASLPGSFTTSTHWISNPVHLALSYIHRALPTHKFQCNLHCISCAHFCIETVFYKPPLWSSGQSSWLQNGDVLCFLWGTNWIYICYVEESGGRSVGIVRLRTQATENQKGNAFL